MEHPSRTNHLTTSSPTWKGSRVIGHWSSWWSGGAVELPSSLNHTLPCLYFHRYSAGGLVAGGGQPVLENTVKVPSHGAIITAVAASWSGLSKVSLKDVWLFSSKEIASRLHTGSMQWKEKESKVQVYATQAGLRGIVESSVCTCAHMPQQRLLLCATHG
eukprot:CAMPEP_0113890510 /NCGR_PEP_ID=MMETSP0780_2-20120614/14186_1 /TAXON_ID=652834 /ORGANISM="Palpitomonas bilix" /LENGTH=159 /DNA_ID=CAMNT_0000879915 /DNA_START=212 /DNA_END=688 /DNA_ORIENTATION=- /assembly_acc=CAM_ASM_000599